MKDRIPTYPGRVELTPVPGQPNKYDMVMADEPTQEGDAPIKKNLLSDATAALYGLGADAVPNEALAKLAFASQYVWLKKEGHYQLEFGSEAATQATRQSAVATTETIYYTDSFSIDPFYGTPIPSNAKSVDVSYNTYTSLSVLCGKYWSRYYPFSPAWLPGSNNTLHWDMNYSPLDAEYSRQKDGSMYNTTIVASPISYSKPLSDEANPVLDPDGNTYPAHGVQDGDVYHALGKFKDAVSFRGGDIVTGTYTGTGYNAPAQTIQLGFVPVLLIIAPQYSSNYPPIILSPSFPSAVANTAGVDVKLSGTTFIVKGAYNSDDRGTDNSLRFINPFRYFAWRPI